LVAANNSTKINKTYKDACDENVLSLIPTLQKNLLAFYDPEKIKTQLQQKSISTQEKYSLWNNLKNKNIYKSVYCFVCDNIISS